jgi:hypothetical protein
MWRKFHVASALGWLFMSIVPRVVSAAAPNTNSTPVSLTVSIFNDADVPPSVLQQAENRARAVMSDAGVSLTWLDCGVPGQWRAELGCQAIAFPTHFSVRLVAGRKAVSDDTFGQSYLNERGEGNYANVYVTPLSSARTLSVIQEGDLLGYVVAHELGHLLLGKESHSAGGLMRARWKVAELQEGVRGNLVFSRGEAGKIRSRYLAAVARAGILLAGTGK